MHVHVHVIVPLCRILNKLTPDNFEKLSFELARHAGINNKEILKGAILLVSVACAVALWTFYNE
jgi:hypothetical protein